MNCYDLGANSYVQKPVDFDHFRETVKQLCLYWLRVNQPPAVQRSRKTAEEGPMSGYGAATEVVRRPLLRVLFVEDMPTDVKLCVRELKKAGSRLPKMSSKPAKRFLKGFARYPTTLSCLTSGCPMDWNRSPGMLASRRGKTFPSSW